MKGYLTVFLAMSLSILAGFILFLTEFSIRKSSYNRLESVTDAAINSTLSEYSTALFEKYGLLYVDTSYLNKQPSENNLYDRLEYYIDLNTKTASSQLLTPWGMPTINHVDIIEYYTAVSENGASMRNQAIQYIEDTTITHEETRVLEYLAEANCLEDSDPMNSWNGIMENIAGMELPIIINEKGLPEEVPLSNPADWAYQLAGSDILFLAEADMNTKSTNCVDLAQCLSHRKENKSAVRARSYKREADLFMNYLFEKMGRYDNVSENTSLACQLEYLAKGMSSDMENVRKVAEHIFRWRFADNLSFALSDSSLRANAEAAAMELYAVTLKEDFMEPVTESILYACAFLESIGDMRQIYHGGRIPMRKSNHKMSVEAVKNSSIYQTNTGGGLSYGQYLACILYQLDDKMLNYRAMDVMEMDIRILSGNLLFAMDWCIESYQIQISAVGSYGGKYHYIRHYGYH